MKKLYSLILFSSILYSDQPNSDQNEKLNLISQEIPSVIEEKSVLGCYECCPLDFCTEVQKVCSTLTLRHIEPGGIGYCNGYTTLEGLFFPFCNPCNRWWFLDLRAHYFNNDDWAGNLGIGLRQFNPCTNVAFGINAYFDFRTDCHRDFFFPQVGIGLEKLGKCWDIRINGYIPFDRIKRIKHCHFDYPGGFFIDQTKYRAAHPGVDAELGSYFLRTNCFKLYAAIGPYYYWRTKCSKSFAGGRARAIFTYTRHLTLEGFVTHDEKFKTNFQGMLAIHIPFGCCPCKGLQQDILSQDIWRNEIIVLERFCKWKFNF